MPNPSTDAAAAAAPKASWSAFLTKLYALLKAKTADGDLSADDFRGAVAQARGHAGGKAKADNAAAKASDWYDPYAAPLPMLREPRLEKADERVNYRAADQVGVECGECRFSLCGACRIVEGAIDDHAVCDLFATETEQYTEVADLCATAGGGKGGCRLFNEVRFAEPPDWIPLLPAPGTYPHPAYGDIRITPERNERFVDGIKRQVYQSKLPVDAEHETKLSGATGWIVDARVNADGSADGKVEWTDRGRALIEADRFKYISPEWYDQWDDPATGDTHRDVLVGAALTTRPFFKDKALRPLVASERGLSDPRDPDDDAPAADAQPQANKEAPAMTDPNAQTVAMSEDQSRRFAEMENQLAAYKAMAETNAQQAKQAAEAVKSLQLDARRKRFTDVVMGRDGAGDGAAWFGEPDKNVSTLETLADALGEDSEQFKDYVTQQRGLAEQVAKSNLFREIGTGAPGSIAGSAVDRFDARVKAHAAEHKITYDKAVVAVAAADPQAYSAYRAEQKSGRR